MDCEQAQQFFHAYIDGELPFKRARTMQSHLEECDDCLDRVLELYSVDQQLAESSTPSVSDSFTDEVMDRVSKQQQRNRMMSIGRWAGLAATLVVGLFLGSYMAVDVNNKLADEATVGTEASTVTSVSPDNQQVTYRPDALSEPNDGSLADRYFMAEAEGPSTAEPSP